VRFSPCCSSLIYPLADLFKSQDLKEFLIIIPNVQRWGCASYWTPCSDIPRFLSWFAAVATTAVQHGEDTPPPPLSPTWSPYLHPLIFSPPFLWNCSALAAMNPLCHCTYFPVAGIQESFALCCGKGHGFLCFCWETHVHHVPSLLWPFKEIPCCCSASWRPSQCAVSPSETSSTSHRVMTVLLSVIGVGRHRGHVQQPWTLMWVPPPSLNPVYILFFINHEP
jgi:hypothetical protein